MDLFENSPELENFSGRNLLPFDGTAIYHGRVFPHEEEQAYLSRLLDTIPWKRDEVVMFGRRIITARKVAWFGDSGFSYTYSGSTKQASAWTPDLLQIKQRVEALSGLDFNSCLLNLYHNGGEGMSWHSDDEKTLGENPSIASVSFGAARKFSFKHRRTLQTVSLILESGSLLVMKDQTQANWLHCVPKSKRIMAPRVNLTFRRMLPQG